MYYILSCISPSRFVITNLLGIATLLPLIAIKSLSGSVDSTTHKSFSFGLDDNVNLKKTDKITLFKQPNLNNRPEIQDIPLTVSYSDRTTFGVSFAWKIYEHSIATLSTITRVGVDIMSLSSNSAVKADTVELSLRGYYISYPRRGVSITSSVSTYTADIDMGLRLQFKEIPFVVTLAPRIHVPIYAKYQQKYNPNGAYADINTPAKYSDGWYRYNILDDSALLSDELVKDYTSLTSNMSVRYSLYASLAYALKAKSVTILPTLGYLYSASPILNTNAISSMKSLFMYGLEVRLDI